LTHEVVGRATQYQKNNFAIALIRLGNHALLTVPDGKHCYKDPAEAAAILCKAEIHELLSNECHY